MQTNIARYGMILNTENYAECVAFYRDLLGLPVLFTQCENGFSLTCLQYGHGYLMVEQGGQARTRAKLPSENSCKLRFNVSNLEEALAAVHAWGIDASITEHTWGRTIDITDPDGNRVGIRDEVGFIRQLDH